MKEDQKKGANEVTWTDRVALSPYVKSDPFVLFYQLEETEFGKTGRWVCLNTESMEKETVSVKPSASQTGTFWVASQGYFMYYQDRYPKRELYQYNPVKRESQLLYTLDQRLGSFQADGEWLVFTTEPDMGTIEPAEEFHIFYIKTRLHKILSPEQKGKERLSQKRHQNWYLKKGKLFFFCEKEGWFDGKRNSLTGKLACYDLNEEKLMGFAKPPKNWEIQQMLWQDETLWILAREGNVKTLSFIPFPEEKEHGEPKTELRLDYDSGEPIEAVQLTPEGFFWLKKETYSLLENASSLWMFSFEKRKSCLLIRLSDFRALEIRFQVIGNILYYQDVYWKEPRSLSLQDFQEENGEG